DTFVKAVEQCLSRKINASITNVPLSCYYEYRWEILRFYSEFFHAQWTEYISEPIASIFIEEKINPTYIAISKANSTTLLIYYR
ncbi:MAG: hypothetical protein N3E52_03970, partial [Candidatus Bathyarchaeota archaeon]|nr:hypothetical protein [Candidatus Bathyarchaeota archaeon]